MINNRSIGLFGLQYGHIFLPFPGKAMDKNSQEGIDYRDSVIKQCFRKQKVSVLFDNGSFANNCPISLTSLREIEFPEKFGQVGSSVVCFIEPIHKKPMVISVFGKESDVDFSNEGDKKLSSIFKDRRAEVGVRGKNGEVYITVDSSENIGGNVFINVSNVNKTGKLNIRIQGDVNIYTSNNCNIVSSNSINASVVDDDNEITTSVVLTKDGKIDSKITDSSGNTELSQTINGFKMIKGSSGLKTTIKNIVNELINFKTVSPGGNGVTDPNTVINLNKFLVDLELYMEG